MTNILVTGGAGYIGSHTLVELISAGLEPIVLDNLCNSSQISLQRVEAITGTKIRFIEGDVRDAALLERIFGEHDITAVVHFAGLKAVGESVELPLKYYDNNVYGSQVCYKPWLMLACISLSSVPAPLFMVNPSKCQLAKNAQWVARPTLTAVLS